MPKPALNRNAKAKSLFGVEARNNNVIRWRQTLSSQCRYDYMT